MSPAGRLSGLASLSAVAVLLGTGCGHAAISLGAGPRAFTHSDYERIYEAWTRDEEDFSWGRMRDVLRVTATFESWEFRWAYVVRYAHDYSIDTEARERMLRTTLDDARENHRFFVTLTGDLFRESDISGRHSAWRVLLVDEDGRQTTPTEIQRIRRPSAAERVYFPSVNHHRETFRITFPVVRDDGLRSIPADAERFRLRFTGARGRVELEWELEPPGEDSADRGGSAS